MLNEFCLEAVETKIRGGSAPKSDQRRVNKSRVITNEIARLTARDGRMILINWF